LIVASALETQAPCCY